MLTCIAFNAHAGTQENLNFLRKDIYQLVQRVNQFSQAAKTDQTQRQFDFDSLKSDLLLIDSGIREYIDDVRTEPRTLNSLNLNYAQ